MSDIPLTIPPLSKALDAHANRAVLPNLDGIRAMACILVVLSHMPWLRHFVTLGDVGVGVFFVLSGFLMSHLYASADWNWQSVSRYAVARFSRIAPIYWLVVTVCILISYADPTADFLMRIEGAVPIARHYLFGGNGYIFWSIPLEVQYYVFFLLLWWAIAARKRTLVALPLVGLLCAALLVTHSLWGGLMLPHKLHFFLAGTLAGMLPRPVWRAVAERRALSMLQLGALLLLALPLWQYATKPDFYAATALGLSMGTAVYLLSIPSRWTALVFATPWVRKIGQASFSIYLLHVLVFHYGVLWLGLTHTAYAPLWLVLGVAGVVLPMVVSHWIELPLQRVSRHWLQAGVDRATHSFQLRSTPA